MSESLDMEHFADPSEPGAKGHRAWLAAQKSTQVDRERATESAAAIRAERRAAYLGGVPDKHHPDL